MLGHGAHCAHQLCVALLRQPCAAVILKALLETLRTQAQEHPACMGVVNPLDKA